MSKAFENVVKLNDFVSVKDFGAGAINIAGGTVSYSVEYGGTGTSGFGAMT